MPDKIDRDGNLYEQGWDGGYQKQPGLFGAQQDKTWLGDANVERDIFGSPKPATDWFGSQKRASDGTPLYQRKASSTSSSSSGDGALIGCLLLLAVIILAGVFVLIIWPFFKMLYNSIRSRNGRLALLAAILGSCVFVAAFIFGYPIYNDITSFKLGNPISFQQILTWSATWIALLVLVWGCFIKHWATIYYYSLGTLFANYLVSISDQWQRTRGWF